MVAPNVGLDFMQQEIEITKMEASPERVWIPLRLRPIR